MVVALGGNAILQPGQVGTFEEQLVNVDAAMRRIAQMVADGWPVVLTHGNGPQVGNLLIQQELAAKLVAPMPMDVCGAMSQGQIGYMLEQTLQNHLRKRKLDVPVVTAPHAGRGRRQGPGLRQPLQAGRALLRPKPRRKTMMLEQGFAMKEDAGRGWRRVVPSPEPIEIVPREAIVDLVRDGVLVICSGGGGIPVVRARNGALSGVDAVIDKDLAADACSPSDVGGRRPAHPHRRPQGLRRLPQPEQRALGIVPLDEMEGYAAEGHFKAGSMGPKVDGRHALRARRRRRPSSPG